MKFFRRALVSIGERLGFQIRKWTLTGVSELSKARKEIAGFATSLGFSTDWADDLKLAMSEAAQNFFRHCEEKRLCVILMIGDRRVIGIFLSWKLLHPRRWLSLRRGIHLACACVGDEQDHGRGLGMFKKLINPQAIIALPGVMYFSAPARTQILESAPVVTHTANSREPAAIR